MSYIGRGIRRLEDRKLLTGAARFVADISFPEQLHMRVVRSPVAFGRLRAIDVRDAVSMPGIAAVWTHEDVAGVPPIDFRMTRIASLEPYRQSILAHEFVRYVGEPLAVVFGGDPYLAEDAADRVVADIDDIRPCMTSLSSPIDFGSGLSSEAAMIRKEYGDVKEAFSRADGIVELELCVGRHSGVPLETRGVVARYDPESNLLQVYGAAKVPHYNRGAIAAMLDMPSDRIQLYEGDVGGGFGIRGELYPEDVLVCLAARRFERPVKWIEDRREHLIAANHSRDQTHRIRAAFDKQGFVLAIDDEFWADQGAYVRTHAATVADLTAALLPGPYIVPAYRAIGHIRLTNKTPAGTYRAPGRYEGTFVRERLMDEIARRLNLDPLNVRQVNLIPPERMPFHRKLDALGTSVTYDSGDYPGLLAQTLDRVSYETLKAEIRKRRAAGEMVGVGVALFVEKSGLGPLDLVRIRIDDSGRIQVVTGVASLGQGVDTILTQICADALGTTIDGIDLIHGQTDQIEHGMGAFASRVTVMAGSAVHIAATGMRGKVIEAASQLLKVDAASLEIEDGIIRVRNSATAESVTFTEAVAYLRASVQSENGVKPRLESEGRFSSNHMTYPYGVHLAVVRVDSETFDVRVERIVISYDVGRAVNPLLVEGQLVGAAAQGLGGAIFEEFVYDELGQPLATSFMDYLIPTMAETPNVTAFIFEDAPSPLNPLGVKGAGEGGITAVGAAIAAAVDDAITPRGRVDRLPITPPRLHSLLTGE